MSKPTGKLAFAYATIVKLEARIAELEAVKGQGEPVAWMYKEYVWATGLVDYVWRDKIEREAPDLNATSIKDLTPLYAEQPVINTVKDLCSAQSDDPSQ